MGIAGGRSPNDPFGLPRQTLVVGHGEPLSPSLGLFRKVFSTEACIGSVPPPTHGEADQAGIRVTRSPMSFRVVSPNCTYNPAVWHRFCAQPTTTPSCFGALPGRQIALGQNPLGNPETAGHPGTPRVAKTFRSTSCQTVASRRPLRSAAGPVAQAPFRRAGIKKPRRSRLRRNDGAGTEKRPLLFSRSQLSFMQHSHFYDTNIEPRVHRILAARAGTSRPSPLVGDPTYNQCGAFPISGPLFCAHSDRQFKMFRWQTTPSGFSPSCRVPVRLARGLKPQRKVRIAPASRSSAVFERPIHPWVRGRNRNPLTLFPRSAGDRERPVRGSPDRSRNTVEVQRPSRSEIAGPTVGLPGLRSPFAERALSVRGAHHPSYAYHSLSR